MLALIQSRVHVNRVLVFVVKRQTLQELEVLHRKLLLKQLSQLFTVLLATPTHGFAGVLLKRTLTTRHRR
jgi:hypothetical protein